MSNDVSRATRRAALMPLPQCPEHGPMDLQKPGTREQAFCGTWYRCTRCTNSAVARIDMPTDDEIATYRNTFRAELDKRLDTKHPSASPSTEAHTIALRQFIRNRNNALGATQAVLPPRERAAEPGQPEPRGTTSPSSSTRAPTELALCEINRLVLHRDQAYIFRKHEGCKGCAEYDITQPPIKPASAITAPLSERLREVANEVERLKYVGTALTLRGIANALDLVDRRADSAISQGEPK